MIIVPTYNERANIRLLVERIRKVLPQVPILFVDDNSPDGTGQEIKLLQQSDPNIKLLARGSKAGFASAYLDGFRLVLNEHNPEFVVTMDADLSHPPEKLATLIKIAQSGKIAIGSRYVEGGGIKNWAISRRILSKFASFYARQLCSLPLHDVTSGFMGIPAEKLKELDLSLIRSRGYAFLMELKMALAIAGNEFAEVPIIFEERKEGVSKISRAIVLEGIKYPIGIFLHRQIYKNFPAWILFAGSFFVYVATAPRTIYLGDSAEFITAVSTLGIPHPPGYPTYILLAKLFSFLPFGIFELRMGLFSALAASLSLVVFYFITVRVLRGFNQMRLTQAAAFIGGGILAFSQIFWSQAIMSKMYTLHLLWFLLLVVLWIKYQDTRQKFYFLTACLLFGLGFGIHQTLWLFLPVVFLFTWFSGSRPSYRLLFQGLGIFLLGTAVYLYLPIRSAMHPAFDWGQTSISLNNFWQHVLRTNYHDYGLGATFSDKIEFLISFFENIKDQFGYLLVLVLPGLWLLQKIWRRFFWLSLALFWVNPLGIILLRSLKFGLDNEEFSSYYYLPAYALAALWIGFGLFWLMKQLLSFKILPSRLAAAALSFCLLILPLYQLRSNFLPNNLRNFIFLENYSRELLLSLPPNAVLLVSYDGMVKDTLNFALLYQLKVKKLRTDVNMFSKDEIFSPPDGKYSSLTEHTQIKDIRLSLLEAALNQEELKQRPIYTTFITDSLQDGWFSLSNGLVYKFFSGKPAVINSQDLSPQISESDETVLELSYFGRDFLAQYYYAKAALMAQNRNLSKSQEFFIKSIQLDNETAGEDSVSYKAHKKNILGQ